MNLDTRTIFIGFILCLISFISEGQKIDSDTTLYKSDHYRKRIATFNREPILKRRIIFLGNSITEFCDWKNLLNDSTVINRGIAGDNTYGVLARLNDVIIRKPQKLFIEIGINDFALEQGQQNVVKNIFSIVRQIRLGSPQTKIYVVSILPTNDNVKTHYPFAYNKGQQSDIFNGYLLKAAKHNFYYFVDVNAVLKAKNEKLDSKYALNDGIHLNELGYRSYKKLLRSKGFI